VEDETVETEMDDQDFELVLKSAKNSPKRLSAKVGLNSWIRKATKSYISRKQHTRFDGPNPRYKAKQTLSFNDAIIAKPQDVVYHTLSARSRHALKSTINKYT
jgi:hypothetical protein